MAAMTCLTIDAQAQGMVRVRVTAENLAPVQGTFQTPIWVGFHDGTFDTYDRGAALGALVPNNAVERLVEDGATGPLSTEFLASGRGTVDGTIPGPNGPIAPADVASKSFLLNPSAATSSYFSYASMVLPSNDAFVANGNPMAHRVFQNGAFQPVTFFSASVLDGGTEVNDEAPANTAFFGQMAPNTGAVEGGTVTVHPGFMAPGSGGILDDARFSQGRFELPGYPTFKFRLESAPAITADRVHVAGLAGPGGASGFALVVLAENGTALQYWLVLQNIGDVTGASITTPDGVVANLNMQAKSGPLRIISGVVREADLTGALTAKPLDLLSAAFEAGMGDLQVQTTTFPMGALNGTVRLIR